MIATVRIAPIERWCAEVRGKGLPKLVGMPVRIKVETCQPTMFTPDCDGREWMVVEEDARRIRELIGADFVPGMNCWMCSHQLEMD